MKFEEGVQTPTDKLTPKDYLKEKERNVGGGMDSKERQEYLRRNGYSRQGIVQLRERGEDLDIVWDKYVQEQEQFYKIKNTKCDRICKFIGKIGLQGYLEGKRKGESQKLTARARCGNFEERNKYWMREDEKLCEFCLLEEDTTKHKIGECQKLKKRHNQSPK